MENVIIVILVLVAVFFVCRGVTLWYFRINRIVELLEQLVESPSQPPPNLPAEPDPGPVEQ